MDLYDWIVVGNGFAGAALSYELVQLGYSVLVIEQAAIAHNATRYSYGGIPYWSAKTPLLKQLFTEGIERHRQLSEELGADTEFRELDLLMTVSPHEDVETIAAQHQGMNHPPTRLDAKTACEMEPLLNPAAIAAAFTVRHGHVNPQAMLNAYNRAFLQAGGTLRIETVRGFIQTGDRITGVQTAQHAYTSDKVAICAGGLSRSLLKTIGLSIPCYYTQAEVIETDPVDLHLQTCVMPAQVQRFAVEAAAGAPQQALVWDQPGQEVMPPILDPGVFQFRDGHLCMGQVSRTLTDVAPATNAAESEQSIREAVAHYIPALSTIPGCWHQCLVAFSGDQQPLVGAVPDREGLVIFSGFSSPFALLPPLARRFARSQSSEADPLVTPFSPSRFLHVS